MRGFQQGKGTAKSDCATQENAPKESGAFEVSLGLSSLNQPNDPSAC